MTTSKATAIYAYEELARAAFEAFHANIGDRPSWEQWGCPLTTVNRYWVLERRDGARVWYREGTLYPIDGTRFAALPAEPLAMSLLRSMASTSTGPPDSSILTSRFRRYGPPTK